MERQEFEDQMKEAFSTAEVTPGGNVWNSIELDLARAQGKSLERRLAFFKMVAAASVLFALAVGAMSLYYFNAASPQLITANLPSVTPQSENTAPAADQNPVPGENVSSTLADGSSARKGRETSRRNERNKSSRAPVMGSGTDSPTESVTVTTERVVFAGDYSSNSVTSLRDQMLAPLRPDLRKVTLSIAAKDQPVDDPVVAMLASLQRREEELRNEKSVKEKKSRGDEALWTSVGFGAGPFNPVTSTGALFSGPAAATATFASNNTTARKEAKASGVAYTVGMNVGKRIAERWILQGGLNYLSQMSDYTAQAVIGTSEYTNFRPASIFELDQIGRQDVPATSSRVVNTAPYSVNNNVGYLSIPLQAGYLVFDNDIALQLNGGFSTEVFLFSNKTAEGAEDLESVKQTFGEDSGYRALNFSGLIGTELSYRLAERYRISVNPGLRYPLNSIYKKDLGIQSTPLTFDVGVRFRYIFQ